MHFVFTLLSHIVCQCVNSYPMGHGAWIFTLESAHNLIKKGRECWWVHFTLPCLLYLRTTRSTRTGPLCRRHETGTFSHSFFMHINFPFLRLRASDDGMCTQLQKFGSVSLGSGQESWAWFLVWMNAVAALTHVTELSHVPLDFTPRSIVKYALVAASLTFYSFQFFTVRRSKYLLHLSLPLRR